MTNTPIFWKTALTLILILPHWISAGNPENPPPVELFLQAWDPDEERAQQALKQIGQSWKDSYAAMILDLFRIEKHIGEDRIVDRLGDFLKDRTGKRFPARNGRRGEGYQDWRKWTWSLPYEPHPEYSRFKGLLYGSIDPKMKEFFPPDVPASIRLDEVDWGGVLVNGIPPLDHPHHILALEADFMEGSHVVFGVVINGQARAYPKRIIAWHEMVLDRLGGVELALVYCTLCGTAIPYESEVGGQKRTFGTSGFLYQSNKLMFDHESKSLWSTLKGKPVVGPLVGSGLRLRFRPIVTTRWEEWKKDHPDTTVLSLETGYQRDYSENSAYNQYFSTDQLMFAVSRQDKRLKNKEEVLVMTLRPKSGLTEEGIPVAISSRFLKKKPVYEFREAGRELVVVTSRKGASRVYEAAQHRFRKKLKDGFVQDRQGRNWEISEEALVLQADATQKLPRIPAHRAFWFGWYAQFSDTRLIK